MRFSRQAFVVLLVLGFCGPVTAQPREPQLMPVDRELAVFKFLRPYKLAVQEHLLGPHPVGSSVLVFPSFEKEWAIQIVYDRGQPLLVYAVMDTQLWGTLQQQAEKERVSEAEVLRTLRLSAVRQTAPLAPNTAHLVETAWGMMLSAAKQPAEPRAILDGTNFLFFGVGTDGQARAGLARSPEKGTPAAALAQLVEALRRHVQSAAPARPTSEREVVRRARDVLASVGVGASSHAPPNDRLELARLC